jgi:hypothetical protein
MRPERPALIPSDPWARLAVVLWAALVVVICARAAWQPRTRSLYQTYVRAGSDWRARADAYWVAGRGPLNLDLYRYPPPTSALMASWVVVPERLGNALWRLFNAAAFLAAFAWWQRAALPPGLTTRRRAWLFLLALPLAVASLNNGQANVPVIALLLAASAAAARARPWTAALCVALAAAVKIVPLSVGLLLVVAWPRRIGLPLLLAAGALALLPFLTQSPAYVCDQYVSWYRLLSQDDRSRMPLEVSYRDLWLLVRVLRLPVSQGAYQVIQLGLAAACAAAVLAARLRGWDAPRLARTALTLGTAWIALCGPTTESCTFIVVAPALAWELVAAPTRLRRGLTGAAAGLYFLAVVAGAFPNASHLHALGIHPAASLLLFGTALGGVVGDLVRRPADGTADEGQALPRQAA